MGRGFSRRDFVRLGAAGLSLPLALRARDASAAGPSRPAGFGRAKSAIVLFAWGGMSHLDTLDPKPDAPSDFRGEFRPIPTSVDGVRISEHLPRLARQMHRLAIVRSVRHGAPSHRSAAYWMLTGHSPPLPTQNWEATRKDWPILGAQVALARAGRIPSPFPGTVSLPYPMADGGRANGQDAGFLGLAHDPVVFRPRNPGALYEGKSPDVGTLDLEPGVPRERQAARRALLAGLERPDAGDASTLRHWRERAMELLLDGRAARAFDAESEPRPVREAYGDHVCGQSVLVARKLAEAGVPLVTVLCAAGDLNGSVGAHWDTHGDNFNRLKRQMLPPLDQALSALLDDLAASGRLEETVVALLTEFGRTPKISGAGGRDHFPDCFSVAFAGGGIRGGQVYGSSNALGTEPAERACGPEDLQATLFHALGIDPAFTVQDQDGRPLQACDGKPLPLF
jgi:hypothetical protein